MTFKRQGGSPAPEVWLRGPLPEVPPLLMPAAHALLQAAEELERAVAPLDATALWARPGGAASVGFHLRHVTGSIDRLLTYARGEGLSEAQRAWLAAEAEPGEPPAEVDVLLIQAVVAIESAVEVLRRTPVDSLLEPRTVGRQALPTTVLGLLFHVAEHTQRHAGQVVTTAKIVRGLGLAGPGAAMAGGRGEWGRHVAPGDHANDDRARGDARSEHDRSEHDRSEHDRTARGGDAQQGGAR